MTCHDCKNPLERDQTKCACKEGALTFFLPVNEGGISHEPLLEVCQLHGGHYFHAQGSGSYSCTTGQITEYYEYIKKYKKNNVIHCLGLIKKNSLLLY